MPAVLGGYLTGHHDSASGTLIALAALAMTADAARGGSHQLDWLAGDHVGRISRIALNGWRRTRGISGLASIFCLAHSTKEISYQHAARS